MLAYELPPLDNPSRLERAFVSFHIVRETGNFSEDWRQLCDRMKIGTLSRGPRP